MQVGNKKNGRSDEYGLAWFRITVVVISLGLCTGKFLLWLHL